MDRFWEQKKLEEMTDSEWEQLCDHCGRCCLIKLEDEDNGNLYYTNVVCQYHDSERCHCTRYDERSWLVPDCIKVTPRVAREESWLPDTCAYRLLAEGNKLFDWHPLISGQPDSVYQAGFSIRHHVVSELFVQQEDLEDHLIEWSDAED